MMTSSVPSVSDSYMFHAMQDIQQTLLLGNVAIKPNALVRAQVVSQFMIEQTSQVGTLNSSTRGCLFEAIAAELARQAGADIQQSNGKPYAITPRERCEVTQDHVNKFDLINANRMFEQLVATKRHHQEARIALSNVMRPL